MTFVYSLKETINGIRHTRLSHTIAMLIIALLLLILSIVFIASMNINRIAEMLNSEREVQVYLSNVLQEAEVMTLYNTISAIPGVEAVEYISKEKAAEEFAIEFGEDIFSVLGENPLPISFKIKLMDNTNNAPTITEFTHMLHEYPQIDEIVSDQTSFSQLVYFARLSKKILWLLFTLVAVAALFIISNTIRLIIANRQQIIETMKLVGATHGFIRLPYLMQGAFQGTVGGLLAFLAMALLLKIVNSNWPGIIYVSSLHLTLIIFIGFLVGLGGSMLAIRKFLTL